MRNPGSVRFDPYFKLQYWEERSLAWKDVQRAYATTDEARAAMTSGKTWRIMRIAPDGRAPLPA